MATSNQDKDQPKQGGKAGDTSKRGFASMDPQQQREIAAEGGRAAHEKGTAHEFTSEEARRAGSMSHKNDAGSSQSSAAGSSQSGTTGGSQGGTAGGSQGGARGGTPRSGATKGRASNDDEDEDNEGAGGGAGSGPGSGGGRSGSKS